MVRSLCVLLVMVLFNFATPSSAVAEKRVALVIGNGGYTNIQALPNPANDATLMMSTLKKLDFDVISAIDQDKAGMERAIVQFGRKLRSSGKDAVGLFYYAGHGVQSNGVNYLLPLNLDVRDESELELFAVSANWVLGQMENAGNAINMVFLDSCRDNPFKTKSYRGTTSTRGLAKMVAPMGSYIGYATAPDEKALDGAGRNSPFTKALVKAIQMPDLTVEQAFKRTRLEVLEKTAKLQTPWDSSSLTGDFYFAGRGSSGSGNSSGQTVNADALFWQSVQTSTNPASFEAYLTAYPNGKFAGLARIRLSELQQTQVAAIDPASGPEIAELSEERRIKASGNVNVRAGPSTSEKRVGRARGGERVRVTGKVLGSDWYRVALSGGKSGFVHGDLLTSFDPAPSPAQPATTETATGSSSNTQVAVGTYDQLEYSPGVKFRDCTDCPEMIVVPGGRFTMGSPKYEQDWYVEQGAKREWANWESPQHQVSISDGLAVGVFEVTRGQFNNFVNETGHKTGNNCWVVNHDKDTKKWEWREETGKNWSSPGYGQSDDHPVVCVSWEDAKAYTSWLSIKTGQNYRLLSESEWEYVARAGTTTMRYWGDDRGNKNGCGYANVSDETDAANRSLSRNSKRIYSCRDGAEFTNSVGRYKANGFGVHDVLGNALEWVEDCWNDSYKGAPNNGKARTTGKCSKRVFRGGGWLSYPVGLRSANRFRTFTDIRYYSIGFRVARIVSKS